MQTVIQSSVFFNKNGNRELLPQVVGIVASGAATGVSLAVKGDQSQRVVNSVNQLNAVCGIENTISVAPESAEATVSTIGELQQALDNSTVSETAAQIRQLAENAKAASLALQQLSSEKRSGVLLELARRLRDQETQQIILKANAEDVEQATKDKVAAPLLRRLALTEAKLNTLADGAEQLAKADEPIGAVRYRMELSPNLLLQQETAPIGVLLIIFESRPECLVQIASLAIRSGNALILKGGSEAGKSNRILADIVAAAIDAASDNKVHGASLVALLESRAAVKEVLRHHDVVDLCVPRGSNRLVSFVQANTKIPVLGHAEGICHVFADKDCDLELAKRVCVDAKCDYVAACNAMETLLLHSALFPDKAKAILAALKENNVEIFLGPRFMKNADLVAAVAEVLGEIKPAKSLREEYGDFAVTVEIVDNVEEAVAHVHKYGSGHTESVLTQNKEVALRFLNGVDAACVFHNASTRFADGFRFGLGAEVGISTGKIHARGPCGTESLLSTRWKLRSTAQDGHCASDFSSSYRYRLTLIS
ncbi:MAG: hypothetical protein MHM6MM_005375 [Cercozoa sp. M6MM]